MFLNKLKLILFLLILFSKCSLAQEKQNLLRGKWINTMLFDSIPATKVLRKYEGFLYSSTVMDIYNNHLGYMNGNGDPYPMSIKFLSDTSFIDDNRKNDGVFIYDRKNRILKAENSSVIFRKVLSSDPVHVLSSKEKCTEYFTNLLFGKFNLEGIKIEELALGYDIIYCGDFEVMVALINGVRKKLIWEIDNNLKLYELEMEFDVEKDEAIYSKGKKIKECPLKDSCNSKAEIKSDQ